MLFPLHIVVSFPAETDAIEFIVNSILSVVSPHGPVGLSVVIVSVTNPVIWSLFPGV